MSEWKPISEAPEDGTWVLLFPNYSVSHWVGEPVGWDGFLESFAEAKTRLRHQPTHWMPLPSPPNKQE